jgi:hypothetical protein
MTYTPNVPQATQTIAFTQPLIQANFTYVDTAMKVDHSWQGSFIGTEAAGSHKRLDMPNQPVDIVALPVGINAVVYAIGGNVFSWNGGKRPISGVSGRGTIALTTVNVFQTIFTVPAECVGWVSIQESPGGAFQPLTKTFHFFTSAASSPTSLFDEQYTTAGSSLNLTVAVSGGNVQVARANGGVGGAYTAEFKYIYWPI